MIRLRHCPNRDSVGRCIMGDNGHDGVCMTRDGQLLSKEIVVHVHQGKGGRWRWRRIIDGKTVANGPGSHDSREQAVEAAKAAHPGLLVVTRRGSTAEDA